MVKFVSWALRLAAVALLIWFLAGKIDIRSAWDQLSIIHGMALLAGQPFMLAAVATIGLRHARMLRQPPIPFRVAFQAILLGSGLNLVIPARIPEVIKATFVRDRCGIPLATGLAAVVVERLLDLVVLALFAVAVFGRLIDQPALLFAIPLLCLAAVFVLVRLETIATPLIRLVSRPALQARLTEVMTQVAVSIRLIKKPSTWVATALAWGLNFLGVYVIMRVASSAPFSIWATAELGLAMTFGLAIPILPAGVGTFEAAVLFILQRHGIPLDEGLVLTLLLRAQNTLVVGIGAAAVLIFSRRGLIREASAGAREEH